jgi:hypothetical protein
VRKVAPRDKQYNGRAAELVMAVRCDMMVVVSRVLTVKMWARCSVYRGDPFYQEFCVMLLSLLADCRVSMQPRSRVEMKLQDALAEVEAEIRQ